MKTVYTLLIALLLCGASQTAFAQNMFLVVPKLDANSGQPTRDPDLTIPLTSLQYGLENPTTIGSASGGAGAGKTTFNDFVITKTVDQNSPYLQFVLAKGFHFTTAKIVFKKTDGSIPYTIELGTVFITAYSASSAEGCSTGCAGIAETIAFKYGAIKVSDETGVDSPKPSFTWSVLTNSGN